MTGKHTESSQLDVGFNNAQLLYSFFCYREENLADLIVQNTGPENLKPQFSTGPAPSPKEWGGGGKRIITESNLLFLHHGLKL